MFAVWNGECFLLEITITAEGSKSYELSTNVFILMESFSIERNVAESNVCVLLDEGR